MKNSLVDGPIRSLDGTSLSLVVPVFNESESIKYFVTHVINLFDKSEVVLHEIIFINDGSNYDTLLILKNLKLVFPKIKIIDLSRNFGKEAAISAGLSIASGSLVVPIDVDLQDPLEVIFEMTEKWSHGYDVVIGRRVNRDSDTWIKRLSAEYFYAIHNAISDIQIPRNVGDFRLID